MFGLRLAGLIALLLAFVPPHLLTKWVGGRSNWPRRFLYWGALTIGVRPHVQGKPIEAHSFIIANHLSWLDILILGGWTGTAFIAKAEVEQTPLIGWIADQNRTLYVERSARGEVHHQVKRIAAALSHDQPLTVFPEGTTGNGRKLLPFRSTLMEAVAPPPPRVSVRPVAVDYGSFADVVGWHSGEGGIANFKRVLGHRGTMVMTVHLLDPLPPAEDRKALARLAHSAIAASLSSLAAPEAL
ncbi:1-acyl-sn-glycerol-3-phosphate acyltransferase [Sphingomonas sp. RB56-2]|uniref:1-acyl-sn-glycerol-3-phosphate acyltransferase n=1 Tax=Sphingomonas brevis TaxID=2908206 RepID=A0ABT0S931_9SPHN|nr:1-acyl-sn-glycerol-3-phosphate acyltransferase [Sphingomonas brevis]MCL6740914.1 1-acyl-sn-glycerol-3-phosphate acyltransferase [Sphingomonas brevis]